MLEIGQYLISEWEQGPNGKAEGTWRRDILHGTTRARLGQVHSQAANANGWMRWLRSHRLEVKETDDESLLMVVKRPWRILRLWDIYDADNQRMGSIYPPSILDEEGVRRAIVDRNRNGESRILSVEGRELAATSIESESELRLRFADDLEENPFLRMLLLGSAIALDPLPAGV